MLVQPSKNSLLLILFGVWSFLLICRPQDYVPFIAYIRPALSLGILTFIVYSASHKTGNNYSSSLQLNLYTYLIIAMILSIPFSYYRRASLMDFLTYSSVILFLFLFYRIVNTLQYLYKLLFAYCVGAAIYAVYILKFGSFMNDRVSFGEMFDSNDIAYYVISLLFLNILFVTKNNKNYIRLLACINMAIGVIVVLKTGSRGGLLALMSVVAYLLFANLRTINFSFILKIVVTMVALFSLQFISIDSDRYKTILDLKSDYNITGEEGRVSIWKIGLRLMSTHPFFGIGYNRFPEGVGHDREARGLASAKWHTAHNSLIQVGAETGVVGFILFSALSINACTIFWGVAKKAKSEDLAKLGEIAKVGFIGHMINIMFLSQAYSVYWAFYIALSAVLKSCLDQEDTASQSSSAGLCKEKLGFAGTVRN